MPKQSKDRIAGKHFAWNLFHRDGVWYADGRLWHCRSCGSRFLVRLTILRGQEPRCPACGTPAQARTAAPS